MHPDRDYPRPGFTVLLHLGDKRLGRHVAARKGEDPCGFCRCNRMLPNGRSYLEHVCCTCYSLRRLGASSLLHVRSSDTIPLVFRFGSGMGGQDAADSGKRRTGESYGAEGGQTISMAAPVQTFLIWRVVKVRDCLGRSNAARISCWSFEGLEPPLVGYCTTSTVSQLRTLMSAPSYRSLRCKRFLSSLLSSQPYKHFK